MLLPLPAVAVIQHSGHSYTINIEKKSSDGQVSRKKFNNKRTPAIANQTLHNRLIISKFFTRKSTTSRWILYLKNMNLQDPVARYEHATRSTAHFNNFEQSRSWMADRCMIGEALPISVHYIKDTELLLMREQ